MNMFKSVAACAAGALMLGTAGLASPDRAEAADGVNFAMPSVGMLYLPVYVADVMGYFGEQDIDAELQVFRAGGGTAMAAVLGGDMDVYIGSTSAALRAATQTEDAVIAGALMTEYASNVVMRGEIARERGLDEDSTVEERLAALEGLNIGVTGAGSGTHQLALFMLTQAELDPERDATVVFVGGSTEILAAFSRDRIDAFTLSNPTSDTAIRDYDGFLLFNTAAGELPGVDDFLYISVNTRRSWIEEDPRPRPQDHGSHPACTGGPCMIPRPATKPAIVCSRPISRSSTRTSSMRHGRTCCPPIRAARKSRLRKWKRS